MNVPEFVTEVANIIGPVEFDAVCKLAKDGKMGWGNFPNDWGTKDGRGWLAVCVAWARGSKLKLVAPIEDDDDGPYYVTPSSDTRGEHYEAIREVCQPFGAHDAGLNAYCDWSKDNAAALVEEFAKRSK